MQGRSGDGGPAVSALLHSTFGLARDSTGHLYIDGTDDDVVHKVDATTKIISVFTGTAQVHGSSGDGGSATSATLNIANQMHCLSDQLYIANYGSYVVRVVSLTTNIISLFAGRRVV